MLSIFWPEPVDTRMGSNVPGAPPLRMEVFWEAGMAYRVISETVETIRQSPVRAALALLLLITTTVYVCFENQGYSVAEIGETTSFDEVVDLASEEADEFVQVSADEDDAPATTTNVDGRETYIDVRLTHAFVEENEEATSHRVRVTPVSQEVVSYPADSAPVWLLGVLVDD